MNNTTGYNTQFLESLNNVNIENSSNNQVLGYKNGIWVNINGKSSSGTINTYLSLKGNESSSYFKDLAF